MLTTNKLVLKACLLLATVFQAFIHHTVFAQTHDKHADTQIVTNSSVIEIDSNSWDQYPAFIQNVDFLNEFSRRRRVNTLFNNPQGPEAGLNFNYVNSYKGNLSFSRRDLVSVARMPIVFSRYYDSSRVNEKSDFSSGWFLHYDQPLQELEEGKYRYLDEHGRVHSLTLNRFSTLENSLQHSAFALTGDKTKLVITLPNGVKRIFNRNDLSYRLIRQEDRYGNGLDFHYVNGLLSNIKADNKRKVTLSRDSQGRITGIVDDQKRSVSYQYNKKGQLATVIDIGGNAWQYNYTDFGQLKLITNPKGNNSLAVGYVFNEIGLSKVASSQVGALKNNFNYKGASTTVDLNGQEKIEISHSRLGTASKVIRQNGTISENKLNDQLQLSSLSNTGQGSFEYTYTPTGQLNTIIQFNSEGMKTLTYHYNGQQQLQQISGKNNSLILEYDANQRLIFQNDNGEISEYSYNNKGDMITKTVDGNKTTYDYDNDGQIVKVENSEGVSQLVYFKSGKLNKVTFPDGATHTYQYNSLGFRITTSRSNGQQLKYGYDVLGNLVSQVQLFPDKRSVRNEISLDNYNRTVGMNVSKDNGFSVSYNSQGKLGELNRNGEKITYSYDENKRLERIESRNYHFVYNYRAAEKDIVTVLDNRTPEIYTHSYLLEQSINAVLFNRAQDITNNHLGFNHDTLSFGLVSPWGISLPESETNLANKRRRLYDLSANTRSQTNFDKPSSSFFLPGEYYRINCYPGMCDLSSVTLNVSTNIQAGYQTNFSSTGASCSPGNGPDFEWKINGNRVGGNSSNLKYTFNQPGSYEVSVDTSCICVDQMGVYIENVVKKKTVTVSPRPPGVVIVDYVMHIPFNHVRLPYAWENRFYGGDNSYTPSNTSRVRQVIDIDTVAGKLISRRYSGTTSRYSEVSNLTPSGNCIRKYCPDCAKFFGIRDMVNQGQCLTGSPTATALAEDMDTITARVRQRTGTSITIEFSGDPWNALEPLSRWGDISWRHELKIDWSSGQTRYYTNLSHDGFPLHQIKINNQIIHQYHPICDSDIPSQPWVSCEANTPLALSGAIDQNFSKNGVLQ